MFNIAKPKTGCVCVCGGGESEWAGGERKREETRGLQALLIRHVKPIQKC